MKLKELTMDPKKNDHPEPSAGDYPDPFSEPHTIPSGWDVTAFSTSERNSSSQYGSEIYQHTAAPKTNDHSQDTL
jgi:hypothetical protein